MIYLQMLLRYWKPLAVVALLTSFWAWGYRVRANIADKDIAALTASHEAVIASIDATNRTTLQAETDKARAAEQQNIANMAALDTYWTQELLDAKTETDAALAAVRTGDLRLRDRFTCNRPASPGSGVPETAAGTGLGDDATPSGLQIEDAEVFVRFADDADTVALQLQACQAIIRADRQ